MPYSMGKNELSEIYIVKNKIKKHCSWISKLLFVLKYLCYGIAFLYFFISVCIILGVITIGEHSNLTLILAKISMPIINLSAIFDHHEVNIIIFSFSAILMFLIALQLSYLHTRVSEWADGKSPFNIVYVKELRYLSVVMIVLMFFIQPLLVLFGITLFVFSYLMEYGNVLEKTATNTINSHEQMITSLAEIIEAKSGQTGMHVKRVSEYSKVIADGAGISPPEVEEIRIASMLHDVGKLLVPIEIIEKTGKLTDEEFAEMKRHTNYGYNLLQNTTGSVLEKAKVIAVDHHEKWDGNGYNGKSGEEIEIEARIVAIADVYDALVSKRSYKEAWTEQDAKDEIIRSSGSHFDSELVKIFIDSYDKILEIKEKYDD